MTKEEIEFKHVNECLGPAANRYLQLHYYSRASKAVIVRAYCLHHICFDDFLQHLFRRGVLPRLVVYIWELLGHSFNWNVARRIAARYQGTTGSTGKVLAAQLDFGECIECKETKLVAALARGVAKNT